MRHLLDLDILDQKDSGFYNMSPFHNDMRLKTAAQLADATENALYVLAGITIIYALSTIALFFGVYKNKPGLIIPWLMVEFLGIIAAGVFIFMLKETKLPMIFGGQCPYCEYTSVACFYRVSFNVLSLQLSSATRCSAWTDSSGM